MNLFIPYDDSELSRFALREAFRMMTPFDRVCVMATVIVPLSLDVDVPAGEVWKQTCAAEIHLASARAYAAKVDTEADLRCVRVQAHSRAMAIIAGATYYEADTILFAQRAGLWSRLTSLVGPIHTVLRHAPCDVHVVYTAASRSPLERPVPRPSTIVRFPSQLGGSDLSQRVAPQSPRTYPLQQHGGTTPYASE